MLTDLKSLGEYVAKMCGLWSEILGESEFDFRFSRILIEFIKM